MSSTLLTLMTTPSANPRRRACRSGPILTSTFEAFLIDRQLLNLEEPEFLVRATDCIPEMVKLIQALVDKGFAYSSEGSIYYKVAAFPHYGQLTHVDFSGVRDGRPRGLR